MKLQQQLHRTDFLELPSEVRRTMGYAEMLRDPEFEERMFLQARWDSDMAEWIDGEIIDLLNSPELNRAIKIKRMEFVGRVARAYAEYDF